MAQTGKEVRRTPVWRPALYGLALFAGVAAVAVFAQGQRIERVSVNPGSGAVEVGFAAASGEVGTKQVRENQADLEQRSNAMTQEVRQQAPPAVPQTPAIAGTWTTPTGVSYQIQQYGTGIVVHEMTAYGTTGVAQGYIQGDTAQISYQVVDGSYGQGSLVVAPDGSRITASFRNAVSGQTSTVEMTRAA